LHVGYLQGACTNDTTIESTFMSFMKPLKFFSTTTHVGMMLRMVLLFPPSESYGKKDSLESRTIREMAAQQIDKNKISIVELFPYVLFSLITSCTCTQR